MGLTFAVLEQRIFLACGCGQRWYKLTRMVSTHLAPLTAPLSTGLLHRGRRAALWRGRLRRWASGGARIEVERSGWGAEARCEGLVRKVHRAVDVGRAEGNKGGGPGT